MTFGNRKFAGILGSATIVIVAEYALVIADSVIAGRVLGETALGAVALLMPVLSGVSFCTWLLSAGTAFLCQEAIGRLHRDSADRLAGQGLCAAVLLGLLLSLVFYFLLGAYLDFLSPDAVTCSFARDYGKWYPLALLLAPVDMLAIYLVFAYGGERYCVYSYVVQTLVNIVFSYGLCDGRWGLPALGMSGVSLGTLLAYASGLIVLLPVLLRHQGGLRFSPAFLPREFLRSLRVGFGEASVCLFHAVLFLIVAKYLIVVHGADSLPVMAVVFGVVRLTVFFNGVGIALQPMETVYFGEGNELGVKRLFTFASVVSVAEGILLTAIFLLAPELVVTLAGIDDPELFTSSVRAIRMTVVGLSGYAVIYLLNAHYQYVGCPGRSLVLTVLAFLGVPAALLFVFGAFFGMDGVYLAVAAGPLVALAAFLPLFRRRIAEGGPSCMWSASASDREACERIGGEIAKALDGQCAASAIQRLTDVLLLAFKHIDERNAASRRFSRVQVEVSLLFGTNTAELILRDDGIPGALEGLGLPVLHLIARGLNRNVFTLPLGTKSSRFLSARAAGERYCVLRAKDVSLEEVEEIIALDRASLDASYQVSAEQDLALFQSNRENGIVIKETKTGKVVGYSMLLPVKEDVYERIRSGHFIDTALTPDMVLAFDHPGIYRMYFASVVIHPEHRGASLVLTLLDAMVDDFIALAERGIFGKSLTADVVSADGEKFCRLFGLTDVCATDHHSRIFEVSGLPPEFRITTPRTERLAGIYWEKFVRLRLGENTEESER